MRKIYVILALSVALGACQGDGPAAPEAAPQQALADTIPLPDPVALSAPVREAIGSWAEFNTLEERLHAVYSARGPEEMELVLEELQEILKTVEDSDFPEFFDTPAVRSRERVLRTYLLKTRAAIYYRTGYRPALRQFLEAYNVLREQMNRMEASQLDPNLFEDE